MNYVLFVFFIGAFIGWIMEICFKYFSGQSLDKASMSRLPFCALYGTGAVILDLIISSNVNNIVLIFLASSFFLTCLELISGIILDNVFGIVLWNYSNKKLAINKHICGEFMIFWGVMGVVYIKVLKPIFLQVFTSIDGTIITSIIMLMCIIIAVDYAFVAIKNLRN